MSDMPEKSMRLSDWRKRQDTPITIPLSLAYALWDLCCSRGENENAKFLHNAIETASPGYFHERG